MQEDFGGGAALKNIDFYAEKDDDFWKGNIWHFVEFLKNNPAYLNNRQNDELDEKQRYSHGQQNVHRIIRGFHVLTKKVVSGHHFVAHIGGNEEGSKIGILQK